MLFAYGSGYWASPISWWGLALIWGMCAAMGAGAMRLRFALPAGLIAAAASAAGGVAMLFIWIFIYGA
jgi:hypothetical protein